MQLLNLEIGSHGVLSGCVDLNCQVAFNQMKDTAIFINTSRGGIVDQEALVEALENKTIFAAGLDVMTPEPLPTDHPMTRCHNCVLVPHLGSATLLTRSNMALTTVNNILSGLDLPTSGPTNFLC